MREIKTISEQIGNKINNSEGQFPQVSAWPLADAEPCFAVGIEIFGS